MAVTTAENKCSFLWYINNPFLPGKAWESTFYQGSPTITQWKLTLQYLDRSHRYWRYLVFLEFVETLDDRTEVLTERIQLHIELGHTPVFNGVPVFNYLFCQRNRCTYYFGNIFLNCDRTAEQRLHISLHISLPQSARENVENHLVSNDLCLQRLSRDLDGFLSDTEQNMYRDMNLLARNDPEPIQVHSYMLHARWNNFFRVHALKNTVQTNISRVVLSDILMYIYSGQFGRYWPARRDHNYFAELFQVVHRYGLYHLYKVFVKYDLRQTRKTKNPAIMQSLLYPLNFVNGRQITDVTHTWEVGNDSKLTFRLIVRNGNQVGPWLSYSLESTSSDTVHTNVNLAVIKRISRDITLEKLLPFHEQDHAIGPHKTAESRCVLFLACPEIFGPSEFTNRAGAEIKFFIQCYLSVTDETTVDEIRNIEDCTYQDELVRFGVLSDHMRKLQKEGFGSDMKIRGNSRERNPDLYDIHKGIFVCRWRGWPEGLENEIVDIPPEIPENPICTLDDDCLRFVLDYIYTGRVFFVISHVTAIPFSKIYEFASKSRFYQLASLMRSESLSQYSIDLDIPDPDLETLF